VTTSFSGWQAVSALAIGAGLAIAGVWMPNGAALVGLGGSIIGGVIGSLQPWRSPQQRTRASDRVPTAAQGVPIVEPQQGKELPAGGDRRRRDP
jgi:hypothetical protein